MRYRAKFFAAGQAEQRCAVDVPGEFQHGRFRRERPVAAIELLIRIGDLQQQLQLTRNRKACQIEMQFAQEPEHMVGIQRFR